MESYSDDELAHFRAEKDKFFKSHRQSPLSREQKAAFHGLNYFPVNHDLVFDLAIEPLEEQEEIVIQTSTGGEQTYTRYGQVVFVVGGEEARLTVYHSATGFFLPFVDSLAGSETYPAGRYVEPEPLDPATLRVDFNRAYNPYCAYNDLWSCPLTPFENRLKVAIRAGEKNFHE